MRKKRKIIGTSERPRLSVFRSLNNMYAQVIDDSKGQTLVEISTIKIAKGGNISSAKEVGVQIAKKAVASGIKSVVFDRGKYRFHGRVKALAEAAREGGLLF